MTNEELQQLLVEYKKVNAETKAFLAEIDKKMQALDLQYLKYSNQKDIDVLKVAIGKTEV